MEKAVLLGLYSITPLHAGSGSEISVIDLPIQRERHTEFPVIWGQSLKGALRSAYKGKYKEEIFGPEPGNASAHAGAIAVGDAKVLLFPVRSAKGVFAYVTCPLVLERFARDLSIAGVNGPDSAVEKIRKKLKEGQAIVFENNTNNSRDSLVVNSGGKERVILEDVLFEAVSLSQEGDVNALLDFINNLAPVNVKDRLVVVPDDDFKAFVKMTTEVVARIRIDSETGTVASGALWYEEFLPSDTMMYSVITIGNSRKQDGEKLSADEIEKELRKFTKEKEFLQLGGDETIGKGFVAMRMINGESTPEGVPGE
jgi:CRISPR-associated protein Cmr4